MTECSIDSNICCMEHINFETLETSEDILRTLADQNRIRIIRLLLAGGESCVCELVDTLNLPQYSVSRHLTALKRAKIVQEKRQGKWKYYKIHTQASQLVKRLLYTLNTDITDELLLEDMKRYNLRLSCRVDGQCVLVKCCCKGDSTPKIK